MTSYRVYRDCPPRKRQYIRRTVHVWALWHEDVTLALRFSREDAERWAKSYRHRSHVGYRRYSQPRAPIGVYDIEEVVP